MGHELGLCEVALGDENLLVAVLLSGFYDVDDATNRLDGAVERKFAGESFGGSIRLKKLMR